MNITKEQLEERGFEYGEEEYVLVCSANDTLTLITVCLNIVYVGGGGMSDYYEVPNCKTIDDLDSLIKLFK